MPVLLLVTLLVLGVQAPRDGRASAPPTGTGSISGRITDKETGQSIAGAVVQLRLEGSPETVAIADAEGRYEFTALASGTYVLWAGPAEGRATHLLQVAGEAKPGFQLGVRQPTIKLETAQRRTGHDLALARSLAIEGRVVNALEEPLADVEVLVMRVDGTRAPATAHSDDRGEYRVFRLEPGRYLVRARPNHQNVDVAPNDEPRPMPTWHPASLSEEGAGEIVLASRDASGIDIRIQDARTYVLSGTIADAAGDPVDGFVVAFPRIADGWSPIRVSAVGLTGESSARARAGHFTLRGLVAGKYQIVASAYQPHMMRPGAPKREMERTFAEVDVASDVMGLELRLARPRTVLGRVVSSAGELPSSRGVAIHAIPEPGQLARDAEAPRAVTGPDMRFALTGVFARPRALIAPRLPAGWVVQHVRFGGRDITDRYVDLTAGEAGDQLEVALTNRIARVKIRALDDKSQQVESFRILILPRSSHRWTAAFWRCLQAEPTRDGAADIEIVPGEYLVAAFPTNALITFGWTGVPDISKLASRAVPVSFTTGDNAAIEVPIIDLSGGPR